MLKRVNGGRPTDSDHGRSVRPSAYKALCGDKVGRSLRLQTRVNTPGPPLRGHHPRFRPDRNVITKGWIRRPPFLCSIPAECLALEQPVALRTALQTIGHQIDIGGRRAGEPDPGSATSSNDLNILGSRAPIFARSDLVFYLNSLIEFAAILEFHRSLWKNTPSAPSCQINPNPRHACQYLIFPVIFVATHQLTNCEYRGHF